MMRKQIHASIKSGIIYQSETLFPESGTPQGGVISPFLSECSSSWYGEHAKGMGYTIPSLQPWKESIVEKS